LASNLGISRSQLYARAVDAYIKRLDSEAITAKLDQVYEFDQSGVDPALMTIQLQTLKEDGW